MSLDRAIRSGGSAGVTSGSLLILAALVLIASRFVSAVPDLAFLTLLMFANVLVVFALMALYATRIERAGSLSNYGFVLSVAGLLFDFARFFSPLGSVLFAIGLLLFAVANTRRRTLPVWVLWVWFGGTISAVPLVVLGWRILAGVAMIASGVARISLGMALRSRSSVDTA
jgi:hypothetical protein